MAFEVARHFRILILFVLDFFFKKNVYYEPTNLAPKINERRGGGYKGTKKISQGFARVELEATLLGPPPSLLLQTSNDATRQRALSAVPGCPPERPRGLWPAVCGPGHGAHPDQRHPQSLGHRARCISGVWASTVSRTGN